MKALVQPTKNSQAVFSANGALPSTEHDSILNNTGAGPWEASQSGAGSQNQAITAGGATEGDLTSDPDE